MDDLEAFALLWGLVVVNSAAIFWNLRHTKRLEKEIDRIRGVGLNGRRFLFKALARHIGNEEKHNASNS